MKFEDLTGKRFERFVVIKQGPNNKYGHTHWVCKCDCGMEKICLASDLKRGHRRSCGCLRREVSAITRRIETGQAAFNTLYLDRRKSALKRGHSWNLTKDTFKQLATQLCHYCGVAPYATIYSNARMLSKGVNGNFTYNGIDRKDNNCGYTSENCVTCCKVCNFAKNDMSYGDFIAHLDRMVIFRTKKI